ncbi:MAG: hypothetical protein ABSF18_04035 [Gammaproteobacteria bacterium]|jgi:hypothetical protein
MLTPQRELAQTRSKSDNDFNNAKSIILSSTADTILKEEIERIEYSDSCWGSTVDWFNFLTQKRANAKQKIEDLISRLQKDFAIQTKLSQGWRLTIHTRVEKREADMHNTLGGQMLGGYLQFNMQNYYVVELHFESIKPRSTCLPFKMGCSI